MFLKEQIGSPSFHPWSKSRTLYFVTGLVTMSLVNGKMKGMEIHPGVYKKSNEENKLGSEGAIWRTEKKRRSRKFFIYVISIYMTVRM